MRQASLHGLQDGWAMRPHFLKHGGCLEAEHARIPEKATGAQICGSCFRVGFFYEAHDPMAFGFQVAVAGFGGAGPDAEGDQLTLSRQYTRLRHGLVKGLLVGDQMVCRQDEHDGVGVAGGNVRGGGGHGGGGVAAKGFEQERGRELGGVDFVVFVRGLEEQGLIGDGEDFLHVGQACAAQKGFLQQALTVGQADEGLGVRLARYWPQA